MLQTRLSNVLRALLLGVCLIAPIAGADWLVTLEGTVIETQGPWSISGATLTYTDLEGQQRTLPLREIDIEGSEATTAFKQGRPYVAPPKPVVAAASREKDEPKIILYQTSWCGYCRKARKLLDELGAEYVTKDIEKDLKAGLEYHEKGKGYRGIPLIDFDGEIVLGYNEHYIRRYVAEIAAREKSGS